ncbi:G2/mitotic-specific cyclin-A [Anopheles aquasalis]|uniref:G2/mitotic-specific cyclin-A n=1 Tax=Anopheles aquasalis TaxID=42839 RepID=UPI00215B0889|nr:G2/mitotic-specific cyclin-A [Anopheles aquasalis]
MASFRVHEDLEKENRGVDPMAAKKAGGTVFGAVGKNQHQPQRTMLNVLNTNIPHADKTIKDAKNLRATGGAAVMSKVHPLRKVDENACIPRAAGLPGKAVQKATSNVTEAFKGFQVYDESKENLATVACLPPKEETTLHEKREPLQEIKNVQLLETPMSVGDSYSPMSVDKSTLIVVDDGPIPKNDRERFYEVEEYQEDILHYLKEAERRNRPKPNYMMKQTDINHSMRTILVDWLVEVSEEYKLHGETLALAVSYIDRFLSFMSVVRAKLQLVGTAAMFIAAKYEEIFPPDVSEFVYITDDTYTKNQVLRMEQLILKVLSFDLTVPTALVFTNLYCVMNDVPDKVKYLTMYLCELSMLEADPYLTYVPSKIAAGALALARRTLDLPMWSKMLENNTGYKLSSLKDIILDLNKTHSLAATMAQQAIQEKYKSIKFKDVASLPVIKLTEEAFDIVCEFLTKAVPASSQQAQPQQLVTSATSDQENGRVQKSVLIA